MATSFILLFLCIAIVGSSPIGDNNATDTIPIHTSVNGTDFKGIGADNSTYNATDDIRAFGNIEGPEDCGSNEVFTRCKRCQDQYCGKPKPAPCPLLPCMRGCLCREGFLRKRIIEDRIYTVGWTCVRPRNC